MILPMNDIAKQTGYGPEDHTPSEAEAAFFDKDRRWIISGRAWVCGPDVAAVWFFAPLSACGNDGRGDGSNRRNDGDNDIAVHAGPPVFPRCPGLASARCPV